MEFDKKKWLVNLQSDFLDYCEDGGQYPSPEIDYDVWKASNPGVVIMPDMLKLHELSKKYLDRIPVHHNVSEYIYMNADINSDYIKNSILYRRGKPPRHWAHGILEWRYRWGAGAYESIMELEGVRNLQTSLKSLYKSLYEYKFILRKISYVKALRISMVDHDKVMRISNALFTHTSEFDFMSIPDLEVLYNKFSPSHLKFFENYYREAVPTTKLDIISIIHDCLY